MKLFLYQKDKAIYAEEEQEALVYTLDSENDADSTVILNQMGRIIWKLCDGTRTREDILKLFESQFVHADFTDMTRDINDFIDQLIYALLLCEGGEWR